MARIPKKPGAEKQVKMEPEARSSGGGASAISDEQIIFAYNDRVVNLRSLSGEIQFILSQVIKEAGIRIHDVSTRVKELASTIKKIRDKEYDDLDRVGDLVGGRVVCLFRSDLENLKELIGKSFEVDEFDDKSYADPDSFGYMSLHFQCRLRQDYSGPRYDAIKSTSFELQLRTICMHAWSAVQHALDYKGEWDVPENLKKDINALSALFYVADTEFATVYAARAATMEKEAEDTATKGSDTQLLNLDTLRAYARSRFPDRHCPGPTSFSDLVQELSEAGYKTIGQVDNDVTRAIIALAADEENRDKPYNSVGAIRVSIGIASPKFRSITYDEVDRPFSKEVLDLLKDN